MNNSGYTSVLFKDGEDFVTSDTIPNDVIYIEIVKPHLEKKFDTKFADDVPAQEN